MYTVLVKLSSCYDYDFEPSGFPDLFGKVFLITFKIFLFDFLQHFARVI